jgi:ABC-type branched-subunit amino acid transport system ATPase component
MRVLTGLLVPDGGRVTLAGFDVVRDNDAIHVASGDMPQRFGLYEDLSVLENMRLYAQLPAPLGLYARLIGWANPGFRRDAGAASSAPNVVARVGQAMYTPYRREAHRPRARRSPLRRPAVRRPGLEAQACVA